MALTWEQLSFLWLRMSSSASPLKMSILHQEFHCEVQA